MNTRLLQTLITSYGQTCKDSILSPAIGHQLRLYSAKLTNRSGLSADLALLKKLASSDSFYLFRSSSGVGTDITAAVVAGTASTILTNVNNDCFIIQSRERFALIGLNFSSASGTPPALAYEYWNGSWSSLTTISIPTSLSTGTNLIFFIPPSDWIVGGTGTTGLNSARLSVRIRNITASSQIIQADNAWIGSMIDYQPNVNDSESLEFKTADPSLSLMFDGGESLLPYFGGVPTVNNVVQVQYMIQD